MDLYQSSIKVLLESQATSGAIIASPAFPSYRYSWFRDGSFIAHALDRVGWSKNARKYFLWSAATIQRYAWKVDRAVERSQKGGLFGHDDYLHARYTVDGQEVAGQWWDFQLDGYGTWLWALAEHVKCTGNIALTGEVAKSVRLVNRYLSYLWRLPNYDCWEERAQYLHSYTLAAIFAGLRGSADLLPELAPQVKATTAEIKHIMLAKGAYDGRLSKSFSLLSKPQSVLQAPQTVYHDPEEMDTLRQSSEASLIGIVTPYNLFSAEEPLMVTTIRQLETELYRPGGGVYRYCGDTYYGGGEWVLLSAWLGWFYAENGQIERAQEIKCWVEAQADEKRHLPEQVSDHLLAPVRYAEWIERWGPVAKPLAWSHAMYLILCDSIERNS